MPSNFEAPMGQVVPDPEFDFMKFEDELGKRFAAELQKAVPDLTPVAREKIITAHDKAMVFALLAAAPPGSVV